MKFSTFVCVAFVLSSSCVSKTFPIKGNYPSTPIVFYSDNARDKVWDNIIDMFAQKGLPIKSVDKASGLIVSGRTTLLWSTERKSGGLFKPDADVVIPARIIAGALTDPLYVQGEWNIRIKDNGDGKTAININLVNIQAMYSFADYPRNDNVWYDVTDARTTGKFEKLIFAMIK